MDWPFTIGFVTTRRIRVAERTASRPLRVVHDRQIGSNQSLVFGRGGTVPIASEPVDEQVSRRALALDTPVRGWHLTPLNRNGVMLYLWGQAPRPLTHPEPVIWPRVALRLLGTPDLEHWVLLDDNEIYTVGVIDLTMTNTTTTATAPPVLPLTGPQLIALRAVFGELLAWPPKNSSSTPKLSKVARQEEIGTTAVQKRLLQAKERAVRLGLSRNSSLVDPEYLYVLVRAGLVPPEPSDLDPVLRDS